MNQYFQDYFTEIKSQHNSGDAREHSYRSAFQSLIKNINNEIEVINEPAYKGGNAPDFLFKKNGVPVAYAECKDVTVDINHKDVQKQAQRYVKAFGKILLTNYHEFQIIDEAGLVSEFSIVDFSNNNFTEHEEGIVSTGLLLIKDYLHSTPQTIKSAKRLAEIMAAKGQLLRDNALASLTENTESTINQQYQSFKEVLIHDLTHEDFADMYAQTLVYGLFVARYFDTSLHNFSRYEAHDLLPSTNPLLKKFFGHVAGTDYDSKIAWMVDSLVEAYLATDVHAIMHREFEKKKKDPVLHFYETFLAEYDQKLRASRGVYYTPEPVVSFIVRSVDQILQDKFGLAEGLADTSTIKHMVTTQGEDNRRKDAEKRVETDIHRVQILDPAVGTGTFLNEVIHEIHKKFENQEGLWNSYVSQHLLPRLHGFELMMASYTMAHLKLGITLQEYNYSGNDRLSVWLTNSLEEGVTEKPNLFMSQWLTNESNEASRIKSDLPIMVVMGNPPYSGESFNKDYSGHNVYKVEPGGKQKLQERNSKWINDDYVKFIRFAENEIAKTGSGVFSYISPHGYLDNPTFRGMRWHMMETFDEIYVLDLHGNANKKETTPDGSKDENVFDIRTGTAIIFGIKNQTSNTNCKVFHTDFYGKQEIKYQKLASSWRELDWQEIKPQGDKLFFIPFNYEVKEIYDSGFLLNNLMSKNGVGIATFNDDFNIEINKNELNKKLEYFRKNDVNNSRKKYSIKSDTGDWKILGAKNSILNDEGSIEEVAYRIFDKRWLYYDPECTKGFVSRSRWDLMKNFNYSNLALHTPKQLAKEGYRHCFISNKISDMTMVTALSKEAAYVFPLYLYSEDGIKTPNLDQKIWDDINAIAGETQPEDILDYIYGVLHSPSYREKYQEFLKIDFPRVPYPETKELFWQLVEKGTELRKLHLMENISRSDYITSYPASGDAENDNKITRKLIKNSIGFELIDEENKTGRVWINDLQYFDNVPELAWEFYIGGYQPAQKWLKDRRDQTLTFEDIDHYQKIIYALANTDRIMKEIDRIWDMEK